MKRLINSLLLLTVTVTLFAQNKSISVERKGAGTELMLLPGFGCPGAVWNEYSADLKNYRVHQVSYAGFNQLPAIDTPWYRSIRDGLVEYIQKQDLRNLHLIGHSMGGNLATEIAALLPDRVTKLVIVDAIPCMREVMMPGMSASQLTYDNPYN